MSEVGESGHKKKMCTPPMQKSQNENSCHDPESPQLAKSQTNPNSLKNQKNDDEAVIRAPCRRVLLEKNVEHPHQVGC